MKIFYIRFVLIFAIISNLFGMELFASPGDAPLPSYCLLHVSELNQKLIESVSLIAKDPTKSSEKIEDARIDFLAFGKYVIDSVDKIDKVDAYTSGYPDEVKRLHEIYKYVVNSEEFVRLTKTSTNKQNIPKIIDVMKSFLSGLKVTIPGK